jgi:hypothetical protein
MSLQTRNTPNEEVIIFKKGVQAHTRRILNNFNDWEFYTGESMDVDGMYVQFYLSLMRCTMRKENNKLLY